MTRLSTFRNIQEAAQDTIGLDSAGVLALAGSGGSMSVFSTKDSLPMTGLTNGDQALVTGNGRLYVSNGYGWYSTSLINLSPTFDSDINSSFSIVDSQTPLVITNPASDSDDATITYGGIVSDSAQYLVTITRDSSVWTFTPLSADSVGLNATAGLIAESSGGTFTYTFTASDGVNQTQKQVDITYSLSSGPYTGSYGDATYAEIDVSGQAYEVVTFTSSGTLKVFQDITAEYLILGGGGGGARGGGGAGGLRSSVAGYNSGGGASAETPMSLTAGDYTVTVGTGGSGTSAYPSTAADSGGLSSLNNIIAYGGGGGGGWVANCGNTAGNPGGCGGGGGNRYCGTSAGSVLGGAGVSNQGYGGGNGFADNYAYPSGGGGGTGGAGLNATNSPKDPGNGGPGTVNGITGSNVTYGGGGGGNAVDGRTTNFSSSGGSGGGGAGGVNSVNGNDATDGLGGGGGAGYTAIGVAQYSGDGGDGIVIIRYPISSGSGGDGNA